MKKIISAILALTIILGSSLALAGYAANDNSIVFAVATDIHAEGVNDGLDVNVPGDELYFHARNSGNLYAEAYGILKSFLKEAKKQKVDFVLIPGDMSNGGKEEQHIYMASLLEEFEKDSGIPVYVTPGNHDYYNSGVEDFKKYYNSFGFDEAIAVDDKTASYVVDLPGDYRLISIDSQAPGKDGDALDERLFSWIEEQAAAAVKEGKTLIAMMHCPLLDPIPYAETLMKDFIVRDSEDVAEKFTSWNIPFVFTGHEHGNNITSYTGKNGKTVYDILTTALTSYPLEYRICNLDEKGLDIRCEAITECDFDNIGVGYNESQLKLMKEDYTAYAKGYFKKSIEYKISKYITPEFINKKLKQTSGPIYEAVNTVMPLVTEALNMPLYAKDTDGISVESLAAESGITLPESEYETLFDLASGAVAAVYYGAENMPFDESPEAKVLIIGLNTMLKYILAEAGNRSATLALNSIISVFGFDEIETLDLYRWNTNKVLFAECQYEAAYMILEPILGKFLVDDELCDRDCYIAL